MATAQEINLVCMSGQGSVQAIEIMAKAYYMQHAKFVASQVSPGSRSKSSAVISFLRVSDQPTHAISANFHPSEVLIFWDGLIRQAARGRTGGITDAIGRLQNGLMLVNTRNGPREVPLPFKFDGTVATIDADDVCRRHLGRNPPPVGIAMLGAYASVTGALDMKLLEQFVLERFPGKVGEQNVAAMWECYERVAIAEHVLSDSDRVVQEPEPEPIEEVLERAPQYWPVAKPASMGRVFRTKIPISDDAKCACKGMCVSEALCPDNTGFIVRDGLPGQGYRIDVDHCRGCGICAEVCVFGALTMVFENDIIKENPTYEGISVAPFLKQKDESR